MDGGEGRKLQYTRPSLFGTIIVFEGVGVWKATPTLIWSLLRTVMMVKRPRHLEQAYLYPPHLEITRGAAIRTTGHLSSPEPGSVEGNHRESDREGHPDIG